MTDQFSRVYCCIKSLRLNFHSSSNDIMQATGLQYKAILNVFVENLTGIEPIKIKLFLVTTFAHPNKLLFVLTHKYFCSLPIFYFLSPPTFFLSFEKMSLFVNQGGPIPFVLTYNDPNLMTRLVAKRVQRSIEFG